MATVDDRVVAMSFENSEFNSNVEDTVGVLGKLRQALNLDGAARGLEDIDAAGQHVDLSHIGRAAEAVGASFSVLRGAAAVALGDIVAKATEAGAEVVKSFGLDPVIEGFHNWETQINAVQTIMANTGLSGAQGLGQVNAVLKDLQKYANLTVYNFADMAKNIGTFTAAGVDLHTAAESIKGIANLAALSGSSAQQASGAMYQLSQAIAAGKVQLQDWNSVVTAGIGGKVFQKALFDTAKAMGTLKDVPMSETFEQWEKAGNSFRQSLSRTAQSGQDATSILKKAHEEAAKTVRDAEQSAADSIASARRSVEQAQQGVGDAARQAAKDIKNAYDGVAQAQQNLADTNRQAAEGVAAAVQSENDTVKSSAENVRQALESVIAARRALALAMKPPSADELQAAADSLKTAQLDQADLSDAVTRAQEDQTRATQDLATAQQQLSDLQKSGNATPAQLQAAQRAEEDAAQKVKDLTDAQTRALLQQRSAARGVDAAEQQLRDTREKGTKRDKNVQSAQDALTKAIQQYRDAEVKASQDVAKAQQAVADARIKAVDSQKKAEDALSKAEQNVRDVRIQTAESEAKAGQQLVQAEQDQAKAIQKAQQNIADAHQQAADKIASAEQQIASRAGNNQFSWLTSGVLTNTLKQFTGDMTDAQLKSMGFNESQIQQIQSLGKTAVASATHVRTITQLMQSLREEVGTAWGNVFKAVFGDINQATGALTPLHNTLEAFLIGPVNALAKVLQEWSKAGGRTALIDAFKSAWNDLVRILAQVKAAWQDIFPPETGDRLADLTKKFASFIEKLTPSPKTLSEVKRIFEGLFAVLDIGKTIVGDVFHLFEHLFGAVGPSAGGGFLALAAHVGDLLVKFDQMVKSGHFLTDFFQSLGHILEHPLDAFKSLGVTLPPLTKITGELQQAWDKFSGSMEKTKNVLNPLVQGIGGLFQSIVHFLTQTFQNLNFDQVLHTIQVGLLGGIYLLFKRFFDSGLKDALGGGLLESVSGTFKGLTGVLETMQQKVKADILLKIAVAIGILSASLFALSTIDPKRLESAMAGITVAFSELVGTTAIINKMSGEFGGVKFAAIALGMNLLATAIIQLSAAAKIMSTLNWSQLARGLTGVAGLLAGISGAVTILSANSAGMISAGIGIVGIATGIRILVGAVKDFSTMSWTALAKGLGEVSALLAGIGLAVKLFPPGMVAIGLGLVGVGAGMRLLAAAVSSFGRMDWTTVGRGLFSMAEALGIVVLAVNALPKSLVFQAAGLTLVAIALNGIALAIRSMGSIDSNALGKGLLGVGLALTELALALNAMDSALPGAVALGVAAGGLLLLSGALRVIGGMSIGDIVKGLVAMGVAMVGLGIAATALSPAAPAILAFGIALTAVGAGVALAGAGVALLGTGLAAIAVAGPAAIAILLKAIQGFATTVPKMLSIVADSIVHIAVALADAAPQIVTSLGKLLVALGQAVIDAAPVLANAGLALIEGLLHVIHKAFPDIIKAGLGMLVALLKGIADNIGKIVTQVAHIIARFLGALADHLPEILKAGAKLLVNFLEGIANSLGKVVTAGIDIVVHLINGIASNIKKIVKAGTNLLLQFVGAVLSVPQKLIDAGVNWVVQILNGIAKNAKKIIVAATNLIGSFITEVAHASVHLADKGADAVIYFLNGIAKAIRTHSNDLWDAGWNIATAIVDGLVQGVEKLAHHVWDKIKDLVTGIPGIAKHILGISSPSTVFFGIGQNVVQGLHDGIANNADAPSNALTGITDGMVGAVQSARDTINNLLDFHAPTITPVLDLSKVKDAAQSIPGIIPPVTAPVGILAAPGQIPNANDTLSTGDSSGAGAAASVINYTQNNYSPQALSDVEIYRATRNTLSQYGSTFSSDAAYFARGK